MAIDPKWRAEHSAKMMRQAMEREDRRDAAQDAYFKSMTPVKPSMAGFVRQAGDVLVKALRKRFDKDSPQA